MTTITVIISQQERHSFAFSGYIIISEEPNTGPDVIETQARLLAKCINIISSVSELAQVTQDFVAIRNLEMSVLFFLESFSSSVITGIDYSSDKKEISCSSKLFNAISNCIKIFPDILSFIQILFNKVLSNLGFKDLVLANYSLHILKTIIVKIKHLLPREIFKQLECVQFLKSKISMLNFTALGDIRFSKVRTAYFEIVATTYFDDYLDDFREEILKIFTTILRADLEMADPKEDLLRFFRDLNGILNNVELGKIFNLFHRITFPTTLSLINSNQEIIQKDEKVLCALLDFLKCYLDNKSSRLSHDNCTGLPYAIFIEISKVITTQLNCILNIFNQDQLTQTLVEKQ